MPPVKVLQFICPAGFFGAEMWILALAGSLDRQRVHFELAVTHESETQNLEVHRRFVGLGLPGHKLPMADRFDPLVIWRLARLIRRNRIELLHTHGYKSDILGLLAARLAGIKAVATPHGFENSKDPKLQLFIKLGCLALRHFDAVAPLSDELAADMRRIGVRPERVRLIQNGVDLSEVDRVLGETAEAFYPDPSERRVAYVGQLASRKNLADLIRAFDLLGRERPKARLVLMGEGRQRDELETLARSLPSGDRVDFLGYRSDRLHVLKSCHAFAMTSSLEGIPRAMMEAMALGLPAAAYRIPGVDKLIVPGETGLMAEFGDVEGLKACLERLLFSDGLSAEMGQQARSRIVEHFSAARMAAEYTELYGELVRP